MKRRNFLKTTGLMLSTSLIGCDRVGKDPDPAEGFAMLVDTTRCEGCRSCEEACAEANGLEVPDIGDESVFEKVRDTAPQNWSVINRFDTSKGEVFVRRLCMHCVQPACAAACLTRAMNKTDEGPVVWNGDRCMGCRYCMVSCPFDMPKFEYDSANPKISKCRMCFERVTDGELPACVDNCPADAISFGRRGDILYEGHKRIAENPDNYVDHIYGETEAGGTGVLYLASVPFDEIGFRTDLDHEAYPQLTREFLYAVPAVLTIGPALLLGISRATRHDEDPDEEHEVHASTPHTDDDSSSSQEED